MTESLYRCATCGNRTRFDVYETVRRRRFQHYTLSGEVETEEEEIIDRKIDRVVCHWCDRGGVVEELS